MPSRTPDAISGKAVASELAATPAYSQSPDPAVAKASEMINQGDSEQARAFVNAQLEQAPDNAQLQQLKKVLEPKHYAIDAPGLKKKILSFLSGTRNEEMPSAGVSFASPLSIGAAKPPAAAAGQALGAALGKSLSKEAISKLKIGDHAGFEREVTALMAKDPDNFLLYRLRALTRRFLKKQDEARRDIEKALALNPKDGPSYGVKALILLDSGRAADAKQQALHALEINPRDADAHVTLAQAFKALGQPAEALAALRAAAEIEPAFQSLYRSALQERDEPLAPRRLTQTRALYLSAAGLALLFLGASLFMKHATAMRHPAPPMRLQDREALSAVGAYRINRRLGEGGMGIVYEATDETLDRKVALKQMRSEIAGDPRERRRFLKEARLVANLRHPHIVEIFSVVEQETDLFLVFEYLPGETLDHLLRRGPIGAAQTVALGQQIAAALDFAHAQGVVHQDLKPSNVLLSGGHAKVMDFGIARRVQDSISTLGRDEGAGTPAYMAPEQEIGRFRKESDIYAFGVCLYEFLSGRLPFMGHPSPIIKAQKDFPPLSALAGLPRTIDEVIGRALDPNPALRPSSASLLMSDLQRSLT